MPPLGGSDSNESLADLLGTHLPQVVGLESFPGERAESVVFRVDCGEGQFAFLKVHQSNESYRRELDFYNNFAASLEQVPRLIGFSEEQRAVLLKAVPGIPCRSLLLAGRGTFHLQAGEFLSKLHNLPASDQNSTLVSQLTNRLDRFKRPAIEEFGQDVVDQVVGPLQELMANPPELTAVPCHGDFMEQNWLCSGKQELMVVDFEEFRIDCFLSDLCQMKARAWASEPGLENAFFQGYGRDLSEWESQFLHHWSLVWSYRLVLESKVQDDKRGEKIGRRAIHFLGQGPR